MKKTLPRGVIAAMACALVAAGQASAATQVRNMTQIGASMCTLSIPSIDTKVRPKAIGYGNEGTASAFVICSFGSPPGGQVSTSDFSVVRLLLKSMDGATHNVTCTAVNSAADGGTVGLPAPQYVSKTIAVNDSGPVGAYGTFAEWSPQDFGAAAGTTIPWSAGFLSVTCILPPQVAIKLGYAGTKEDVGS